MESNYKVAYKTEWKKLKQLNPFDISRRLEVKYDDVKKQLIVPFFNKDYILDYDTERIFRKEDDYKPKIGDSIIILNYLTYSTDFVVNTNKWVTLKEIPNGGALFYPAFYKSSIKSIINFFGEDITCFENSASKLGGTNINFGDRGYIFNVLPKINICIVVWEGDEEMSSNATILFEPSIKDLVHIETVIGIGMCVSEKLISNKKHID